MGDRPESEVRKIRFALTCAGIFAIFALFMPGIHRWWAATGVLIWVGAASFVELQGRRARRRATVESR